MYSIGSWISFQISRLGYYINMLSTGTAEYAVMHFTVPTIAMDFQYSLGAHRHLWVITAQTACSLLLVPPQLKCATMVQGVS